jgi:hypothetical protein
VKKFTQALSAIALALLPAYVLSQGGISYSTGSGSGGITSGTTIVSGCGSGTVIFNLAGVASCDTDMTFATDTFTATKIIGSTSITNSSLTSGRLVFSGASGIQSDDADLTFVTDALTATKHRAADGTVALPSYSFTNSTNSGMYLFSTQTGPVIAANGNNEIVVIPNYTMFRNITQLYGSTTNIKFLDTADPGSAGTGNYVGWTRDSAFTLRITDGGSANGAGYGYLVASRPVIPKASTPYSVLVSDGNKVFTNEGASAQIVFNLPSAAAGMGPFTVYVQDTDGIQVAASTGDTIRVGTSVGASGGTATNATAGSFLTLIAINATEWVAFDSFGTWTLS